MGPVKNRSGSKFPKRDFQGKKAISADLVLIGKKRGGGLGITISISKKVAPRAVDRNRIKRIIKEGVKESGEFKGEFLIIVKKNLAHLKMPEVKIKLDKLLRKL